ncbi:MAG: hypothetical protein IT177_21260 [Acidobacteria bacterium]|nr:hypothetical protein [Acidobacteriota bacterium]
MKPQPGPMSDEARQILRHTVATLAYRAEKVLRDAPEGFAELRVSPSSRTALETLGHMCDLMGWGERMARGTYHWEAVPPGTWAETVDRFFTMLGALDAALAGKPAVTFTAEVIFQGPVADALTHVGQLAMMRGTVAAPVRPESYARADIAIGRVGQDQAQARYEFSGDASRPKAK